MGRPLRKDLGACGPPGGLYPREEEPPGGHGRRGEKGPASQVGDGPALFAESLDPDWRERSYVFVLPARTRGFVQFAGPVLPAQGHLHLLRDCFGRYQSL